MKGKHGTNLEMHLGNSHPNEFTRVQLEKEPCKKKPEEVGSTRKKKSKLEILTEECVKFVTVHGRPFSITDDKAFQNIVALIPQNSNRIHINSHNIKQSVATYTEQIREKIRGEINGTYV